eukprot:TRINITY_DN16574_c0_g1_i1.p1 TRINITY_DN16574_c0_g1~~TRINITY_DN16574_c0_g1_i1.p1  ORF type:complete len:399 (+),score=78.86 TRINITY_DN16574_c0_g1_i1:68-1198(+)
MAPPRDAAFAGFRPPRGNAPTRHLYLARCGVGCGDTQESILEALLEAGQAAAAAEPELERSQPPEVFLGDGGVSYASYGSAAIAAAVRGALPAVQPRWVICFAEREGEAKGPLVPRCLADTKDVSIDGLEIFKDFLSQAEADTLLAEIDGRPWDTSIKRRVQHYGRAFDYARLALAEPDAAAGGVEPFPAFLRAVARRVGECPAVPQPVDQLTVNEYEPGIGIASHCDAHSAFEGCIVAITLGSGIVMDFRRPHMSAEGGGKVSVGRHHRGAPPPARDGTVLEKSVWLPANSMLVLRGEARYAWQHGIAWRKTDCLEDGRVVPRGRRVSMTFRAARGRPCECGWPALCDAQNPEAHVLPSRLAAAAERDGDCGGER